MNNFKFTGMIQQLFLHGKESDEKEKIIYHNHRTF